MELKLLVSNSRLTAADAEDAEEAQRRMSNLRFQISAYPLRSLRQRR